MNLNIGWTPPSPIPTCGYKALYRRNGDPAYTQIETSGTSLVIPVTAPVSYEGTVISDCCESAASSGIAFGINAYSTFTVSAVVSNLGVCTVTIASTYPNPYATVITGSFVLNGTTTVNFSITYAAGYTTQSTIIAGTYVQLATASNYNVSSVAPVFNNGGQLQQFDSVNTPEYFGFYWSGNISGTTWDGSPVSLPSFSQNAFNVTEIATDGTTVLAGNFLFSYILDRIYANSFNTVTFEVFDGATMIGTTTSFKMPLGLRQESIALTKGSNPLGTSTAFTMKAYWPDGTLIDTRTFYLP